MGLGRIGCGEGNWGAGRRWRVVEERGGVGQRLLGSEVNKGNGSAHRLGELSGKCGAGARQGPGGTRFYVIGWLALCVGRLLEHDAVALSPSPSPVVLPLPT